MLAGQLFSQVNASFSASDTSGCSPLVVVFNNTSTGSGTLTYNWDLGNGNTSPLEDPLATYSTPGTYTVILTTTNGTSTDTHSLIITVFANPTAGFSIADSAGCAPFLVVFTNTSTPGDGAISQYQWDLGGGVSSTSVSPSNTYSPGVYTISLEVTDVNGCSDFIEFENFISVTPEPFANFNASQVSGCSPFTTEYTGTATGTGITYEWDLDGDGDFESTEANPDHFYETGTYNCSMQVTEANGCIDDTTFTITVSEMVADFEILGGNIACIGEDVNMTIISGGTATNYNYGDGTPTTTIGHHVYSIPGEFTITMVTWDAADITCIDTAYQTITIDQVIADFEAITPVISCQTPFTVSFDASASSPGTTYTWNFGDGSFDTESVPTVDHIYSSEGNFTVALTVTNANGCIGTHLISNYITIQYPEITIEIDTTQRDCEREITFTYDSVSFEGFVTWDWNFDNNDPANTSTDNNPTQYYNYNDYLHSNDGVATVTLTVTTASGCEATTSYDVYVGIVPNAVHYIFSDDEGVPYYEEYYYSCPCFTGDVNDEDPCPCAIHTYYACAFPDSVQFNDSSYVIWDGEFIDMDDTNPNFTWDWDFGEEGGTSSDEDPFYFYDDTVGYMDIQLVVGYNQCYDTVLTDSMVYIKGPIIKPGLDFDFECSAPFDYTFAADVVSVTRVLWDYDDGITDNIIYPNDTTLTLSQMHTYAATGDYWVKLYAFNDSTNYTGPPDFPFPEYLYEEPPYLYVDTIIHKFNCEFVDSIMIRVRDVQASFVIADDTLCANNPGFPADPGIFDASVSQDFDGTYNPTTTAPFIWNFGDAGPTALYFNPSTATTINHSYSNTGAFNVTLIVNSINGCSDTFSDSVYLFRPVATFTTDNLDRCAPFIVEFYETSNTLPSGDIVEWDWDFNDDGTMDSTYNVFNDTIAWEYMVGGTYQPTLIVTDEYGCMDSVFVTLTSWYPNALINVTDTSLCAGDSVLISNSSSGINCIYYWYVNDSLYHETNLLLPFLHTYADSGAYDVMLISVADGDSTCRDTCFVEDLIHVQDINADLIADETFFECNPANVIFSFNGYSGDIEDWSWDFGDGNTSILGSPVSNTYSIPGLYTVSLNVTTTFGCSDDTVFTDYISVNGAYANFVVDPVEACLGDTISYVMTDTYNVNEIIWDFGDGSGSAEVSDTVYHIYATPGTFYSFITYDDGSGNCEAKTAALPSVLIIDMVAAFNTDMGAPPYCESVSGVSYFNVSTGTATPDYYTWDFGNGTGSSDQHPMPVDYTEPGVYYISLEMGNSVCNTAAFDTIEIYANPEITVSEDQLICPGSSAELSGTDLNPVWSPADGLSSTTVANPTATPLFPTHYVLNITDENGCKNSDTVFIDIFSPSDYTVTAFPHDSIYLGEETSLVLDGYQDNSIFAWGPSIYASMLSCTDCPEPVFHPTDSATFIFTVTVIDSLGCDTVIKTIVIDVDFESDMGVPLAFTPNGDGQNDIIYLCARGVDKVYEFRIYNRWGQELFFSDDLAKGWDGFYKEKLQNIDTYVWKAKVRYLNGIEEYKQGMFNLLR